MSKSSAASASKNVPQLPQKSAWSRGPPQSTSSSASTPRSQSPAPNATPPTSASHSRRPSALGSGVSFKEGVGSVRSPTSTVKAGSAVTFGSIDDDSAPISSSPASVPPIKTEGPKSFGTVPATPTSAQPVNGKSSAPQLSKAASTLPAMSASKFDVKKLFQATSTPDVASPPPRSAPLPHGPSHSHAQPPPSHPSQFSQGYSTFVPGGYRPTQNGTNGGPPGPPRSPVVYPRQPANAPNGPHVNGRPPPQGPQGQQMPPAMSSPRLAPPTVQPPTMSPPAWNPYYGYPMDPNYQYYQQPWAMMPQQSPGVPHPHSGLPMSSPRNPQQQLHPPGTPTMSPAVSVPGHPPHSTPSPHIHSASLSSVSSPPATPSSSSGPGARSMRSEAPTFVPGGKRNVVIKDEGGHEVNLDKLKESASKKSQLAIPPTPASPARPPIRLESEQDRQKRLEAEQRRKENEERLRKRAAEEKERKSREEEERKKREQQEAEEKKRKEEEERVRKEEEEKEQLKREEEEKEKERLRKEEEEKKERLRKEEEERERARKEAEEKERIRKEAEEKEKAEKEKAARERAAAESKPEPIPEAEEGEIEEDEAKEKPKEKSPVDKAPLRIDTAISNTPPHPRPRPGPLDLSGAKGHVPAPLPSALSTARAIEDLQSVTYPEGVKSPKVELNANAKDGKFRYDRDFLLQFMMVCKEKPDNLPDLDVLGLQPSENHPMARTTSGRRPNSVNMGPPSRSASVGLGIGFSGKPGSGSGFTMGQFSTPGNKMTSEERFQASRSTSMSGGQAGLPFGRPQPMVRSSSQGGPGTPMGQRTRSRRGEKRGDKNPGQSSQFAQAQQAANAQQFEPVAPLEQSANRWQPAVGGKKAAPVDEHTPEVVDRKVKALLNKLTMERFDSISDQIIQWANKSEAEKDGRTLIQVIKLVFEKATDEAAWSEMYARLCRKMMETISTKVQDDGIRNSDGKPIAGGQLFRKYLLNRCQEDFERGWVAKEATAAAAATKSTEDKAAKAAAEGNKDDESALYSDEYYAAQKAKRQGLGLVKFIGELFKLQMLTERIMHECIKKLLSNVDNPEEEEIESLCKLMTTVGQQLDTAKARAHMDVYFTRMKELRKSPHVNSRMQFMLQDVVEMRDRKWIPRNQVAAPTTIAAVHEAAAKEKAAGEKDAYQRTLSMSRGGSRRGGNRDEQTGPDGWAVAGNAAPARPARAGDLSNFGKIAKTQSMSFGPSSIFVKKDAGKASTSRENTISRASSSNMFSMLSQAQELANETSGPSNSTPEAPLQRRKLNLLPRSVPKDESKDTPAASANNSEDDTAEPASTSMSVDDAKTRVAMDVKEFFSVRDLGEAEVYFTKLPVEHRHLLIDKLISEAIEQKEADARLVADLFARAVSKNVCSPTTFEDGFNPIAELLADIVIDAPKALELFAIMLKGAGLDKDEERLTRIAKKSEDVDPDVPERLLKLLSS